MLNDTEEFYARIGVEPPKPCIALKGDNTRVVSVRSCKEPVWNETADHLFKESSSYQEIKQERPEHRLVLWMTLQGQRPAEIAAQLGFTVVWVYQVRKQPWFQHMFCKMAAEQGRDAIQTLLKSEAMPAIARTVELAIHGESDAVKLAANKELLDRFLGKPVVKAEVKSTSTVDVTVADVSTLLAERAQLDEKLRANGLLTGKN